MRSRVLIALMLAFVASAASAQPKPALVQDRDEPGRNPFQLGYFSSACDGQIICVLDAPNPVPAGRRLVVTQVAVGTATSGAGAEPLLAELTDTNFADGAPFHVSGPSSARVGTFPIQRYYEAGTTPRVSLGIFTGEMSGVTRILLVGYYITLP
jgi:hypothetical protein